MALYTKAELVSQILVAVGLRPIAVLDTDGSSPQADAERILDWETKAAMLEGFFGNQKLCKAFIPAGNQVALDSRVVAIKASGPSQSRHFDIRLNVTTLQVYDLDAESFTIATDGGTGAIFIDLTYDVDIATVGVYMQLAILKRAAQIFQRRFKGNPETDAELAEERLRADALADRSSGNVQGDRSNPPPMQSPRSSRSQGGIQSVGQ